MAFPSVVTEVAFATLPGAAVPTWTDISAYVKSSSGWGAHRQRETDRFEAGVRTFVLDNSDGRFDPNNAASPYSPNVLPMRRIRQRATFAAVTYDLFNGYVEDWPQKTSYPQDGEVAVTATDAFIALASIPTDGSPYELEVRADAPAAWWRLSESDNDGPMIDSAGTYDGHYEGEPTTGGPPLVAGSSLASTYFPGDNTRRGQYISTTGPPLTGYPFTIEAMIDPDAGAAADTNNRWIVWINDLSTTLYGVEFYVLGSGGAPDLTGKLAFFINSSGAAQACHSNSVVSDGLRHHVALRAASAGAITLYVDGVEGTVLDVSGTPAFPTAPLEYLVGNRRAVNSTFGGLLGDEAEVAMYTSALSAPRIAAHAAAALTAWQGDLTGARVTRLLDNGGWPAADRSIDTGVSTLQPAAFSGSLLDNLQAIAETENGALFVTPDGKVKFRDRHALLVAPYTSSVATYSDQAAGINYDEIEPDYAVDLVRNSARVSRAGGVEQRVEDTTSIGKYFRRRYAKSGLLFEKDAEARDHAQWIVNRYKDPPFRFGKLTLTPYGSDATLYPSMLARAIGDRVTVTQQPPGEGTPLTRDMHVDGISHDIGPGPRWVTTLQLSPVDSTAYFTLDTSSLDGTDVLAY